MRIKNNQAQPKASNSCPTVIHVYHYHALAVYNPNSNRRRSSCGLDDDVHHVGYGSNTHQAHLSGAQQLDPRCGGYNRRARDVRRG